MNLIMCCTPLQVLIAERIIDLHPNEEFYGLVWTNLNNEKFRYYFERLKLKCRGRGRYIYEDKPKEDWDLVELSEIRIAGIRLSHLLLRYSLPSFERLYVANIEHLLLMYSIPNNLDIDVITFDDGTRNLFEAYIPSKEEYGRLGRFLKFSTEESLFARHKKHYSIYPYPNSMPNVERISLYDNLSSSSQNSCSERVSIFLGQPIYELEFLDTKEDKYRSLMRLVQEHYKPQYYLPHPREKSQVDGFEYINTPLIFEDYILKELGNHPEREYVIYSFCSSSILNLHGVSRLKFVAIKPNDCPEFLLGAYDAFEKLGVEIHDIDVGEP